LADKIKKMAISISMDDVKDFASTSHKGLPEGMFGFKKFNQLTELAPEEYMEDARLAADFINFEISKMFGKGYGANAKIVKILGYNLSISFADVNWKVTVHNSPVHISWLMHLSGAIGQTDMNKFEADVSTRSYHLKSNNVKPRKVSGKSPMDVAKKIIKWFNKNKDNIIKTYEENSK